MHSRLICEMTYKLYVLQNMIAGKEEGEKENVAQNAKDILSDDSRGTVPVMFDFARREKFSRLQTIVVLKNYRYEKALRSLGLYLWVT